MCSGVDDDPARRRGLCRTRHHRPALELRPARRPCGRPARARGGRRRSLCLLRAPGGRGGDPLPPRHRPVSLLQAPRPGHLPHARGGARRRMGRRDRGARARGSARRHRHRTGRNEASRASASLSSIREQEFASRGSTAARAIPMAWAVLVVTAAPTTSEDLRARLLVLEAELAVEHARAEKLAADHARLLAAYQQVQLELALLRKRIFMGSAERVDTKQLEMEFADKQAELAGLAGQLSATPPEVPTAASPEAPAAASPARTMDSSCRASRSLLARMRSSERTGVSASWASSRISTGRVRVEVMWSLQRVRSALKPPQRLWMASGTPKRSPSSR